MALEVRHTPGTWAMAYSGHQELFYCRSTFRRMPVMSLHPQPIAPVPEQIVRVAAAAFPKGNPYLTLRDQLGTIFQDEDFATLFPAWGYPGLPPWRLALITIMQFRENLADRQAAEAVRARIGRVSDVHFTILHAMLMASSEGERYDIIPVLCSRCHT